MLRSARSRGALVARPSARLSRDVPAGPPGATVPPRCSRPSAPSRGARCDPGHARSVPGCPGTLRPEFRSRSPDVQAVAPWSCTGWRPPRTPRRSSRRTRRGRRGCGSITSPSSVTTSSSTHFAPALVRSVRRLGYEVSVRPSTTPASISVHGPWQIDAHRLAGPEDLLHEPAHVGVHPQPVRVHRAARHDQRVVVRRRGLRDRPVDRDLRGGLDVVVHRLELAVLRATRRPPARPPPSPRRAAWSARPPRRRPSRGSRSASRPACRPSATPSLVAFTVRVTRGRGRQTVWPCGGGRVIDGHGRREVQQGRPRHVEEPRRHGRGHRREEDHRGHGGRRAHRAGVEGRPAVPRQEREERRRGRPQARRAKKKN